MFWVWENTDTGHCTLTKLVSIILQNLSLESHVQTSNTHREYHLLNVQCMPFPTEKAIISCQRCFTAHGLANPWLVISLGRSCAMIVTLKLALSVKTWAIVSPITPASRMTTWVCDIWAGTVCSRSPTSMGSAVATKSWGWRWSRIK